jgi:hypothetical protein
MWQLHASMVTHTVALFGQSNGRTKAVEIRPIRKLIDMTIRTSTIEDLDEEDTLKELSKEEPTPTNMDLKADEIDHEEHKELVLSIKNLEKNMTQTTEQVGNTKESTQKEANRKTDNIVKNDTIRTKAEPDVRSGHSLSIQLGWSDYLAGINCQLPICIWN